MKRIIWSVACGLLSSTAQSAVVTALPGATALTMPGINAAGWQGIQTIAPGITWSSNRDDSSFGYTYWFGFGHNGYWDSFTMIGLNDSSPSSDMTISFSTPVTGFGGLLNYAPGDGIATISAYDSTHALIESKILDFTVPGNNQGVFLGFLESSANISYVKLSGAFIGAANLEVLAVPEPEAYAMLLAGLGLVGFTVWRKRTAT